MTVKEIIELEKRNTQIFKILLRDADTKNKIGFFCEKEISEKLLQRKAEKWTVEYCTIIIDVIIPSLTETKKVIRYKDIYKDSRNYTPICQVCESYVDYGWKFNHCPECGQLLDWSDIKE